MTEGFEEELVVVYAEGVDEVGEGASGAGGGGCCHGVCVVVVDFW